jgi:hypothetical protein
MPVRAAAGAMPRAMAATISPEPRAKHTNRAMTTLAPSSVMFGLLGIFGLAVVVAMIFVLRWERAEFTRAGKGRAWLIVRVATVPITLLTIAAVVLPVRAVSGMEALAVFYLLLFTLAPVLWVGSHWLVGRAVRPALPFIDALQLAVMPPVFAIGAALLAQQLQPLAVSIVYGMTTAR